MWAKYKQHTGFTIVELLIVVVVIAILAAVTIVAYNGVQNKAKSSKTTSAVTEYVKALGLYNADQGAYPSTSSCLGTSTTYPGNAQCWTSAGWVVSAAFNTALQPYMAKPPEPDVTNIGTDALPKRGAFYDATTTPKQLYVMYAGISTCPSIGRLSYVSTTSSTGNNTGIYCIYQLF
jgi:prepilin-type N-terminal cleavage/methylation domain-containing protein